MTLVSDSTYAGDEGGVMCQICPAGAGNVIVVSLTYVRVSQQLPLAAAVIDYQKERVKNIRKSKEAVDSGISDVAPATTARPSAANVLQRERNGSAEPSSRISSPKRRHA